jgi:hypothetical protein
MTTAMVLKNFHIHFPAVIKNQFSQINNKNKHFFNLLSSNVYRLFFQSVTNKIFTITLTLTF